MLDKITKIIQEDYKPKQLPSDVVPVSGKVYDEKELINLVSASLEGWWTEGKWNAEFENRFRRYIGVNYALTVNSGSSANLVAIHSLTSMKLDDKRINKGDEVITLAAGFPTTVNPIINIGAIPVFIDVEIPTYCADLSLLKDALSKKTKAVFFAHTLGNPFKVEEVRKFCDDNNLWLIEDNCDALGSEYNGKKTGSFGDFATTSFYPAHHITAAEGGAVFTNNPQLFKIARSVRDWGRDCWCSTGHDNSCGKRFTWKLGNLPKGYDHKYIYSEIGYNLKMTDLQAAIGVAQMDKLPAFVEKRRANFDYLRSIMKDFQQFILPEPTENSRPSWFGFPITIADDSLSRADLMAHLAQKNIGTRLLFAGNIIHQPYFIDNKIPHRIVGDLTNSDTIMNKTFWLGVYPALEQRHLDYVVKQLSAYFGDLK
ncbi:lipopolysaccharide biosynthesis protein RfbH [Candidatus Micrarchaeota archaeon]|nr:lipopolysaccharide biosynthesis protein RfbH [Candidatus Micrarchaeota archaeon]